MIFLIVFLPAPTESAGASLTPDLWDLPWIPHPSGKPYTYNRETHLP